MSVLLAFLRKETYHILRDRRTLVIALAMPLIQVLLFGFAIRTEVEEVRLAVVDPAPDHATLEIRARLASTGLFRTVAVLPTSAPLERLFQRGDARAAVVFEPGFAGRLGRGEPARVLLVSDATEPNQGSRIQAYALNVIRGYERELGAAGRGVRIVPEVRMRFNPTLESSNLFVPGLVAMILTIVSAMMTAVSLTREKETGTMEVLLVSPLRPWQIIAGKVLPYLVLGFLNVLTALAAAAAVFGVPMRGSLLLFLAESTLFILTSLALGILISTRTDSQRVATMGALVGLMMPTMVLSGFIFPLESLPGWLRPLTNVVPARWFVLIARGIMLKGVGLAYLWEETLVLLGMTLLLLGVGTKRFKIRLR
ncbi:MAG TPA: ABC transporter permease [Longimicrobiaceae bacterium]|nr:ABC transporter permease [Longimicrobiaceae bacterium]